MKLRSTELLTTRTQQLIIPALLSLLLVTIAPLSARADKNKPPPPPGTNPPAGTFTATGSMNVPRYGHQTVLLGNGQVLAVSGDRTNGANTAELYNPATGRWAFTGSPAVFHYNGSVTLLANGEVLLVGGNDLGGTPYTAGAELYNPSKGQWSTTGSLPSGRGFQAAVLLTNGQVLVAGGEDSTLSALADAELYNPATGTWQPTASMHQARLSPTAQLLGDGTVLVASGSSSEFATRLTSAEIYNPSTAKWTEVADMPTNSPRIGLPQSALLANGDVLVARDAFFNPETGTWTPTGASFPGNNTIGAGPWTATLLTTGDVLLTGFRSTYNATPPVSTTVLYDFTSNAYTSGASMTSSRYANAATLLPNGQVLVSGGFRYEIGYGDVPLSSAELYTP